MAFPASAPEHAARVGWAPASAALVAASPGRAMAGGLWQAGLLGVEWVEATEMDRAHELTWPVCGFHHMTLFLMNDNRRRWTPGHGSKQPTGQSARHISGPLWYNLSVEAGLAC